MIALEKLPKPDALSSRNYLLAISEARDFFTGEVRSTRQSRAPLKFPDSRVLKLALLRESSDKCVYCERSIHEDQTVIDRYRPSSGAIDSEGVRSDLHYWWLAYEWENLFASCEQCNFFKGAKFPVVNERIPLEVWTDFDAVEMPLLINPFRMDPTQHLCYQEDGSLREASIWGEFTISTLKLNRSDLVVQRAALLEIFRHTKNIEDDYTSASAPFAGLARDYALKRNQTRTWPSRPVSKAPPLKLENVAEPEKIIDPLFSEYPLIKKFEIKGIFGLDSLEITIPNGTDGTAPCLAILGENGAGKTSILKSIALALYDSESFYELDLNASEFLTEPTKQGVVRVTFDTDQVVELSFGIDGNFQRRRPRVPLLMLAYGATRLLPTPRHKVRREPADSRARNLFDPYSPLRDPSNWLMSIDDPSFDYAGAAIKRILDLPDEYLLDRSGWDGRSELCFYQHGRRIGFGELSHGYRSVLGLACDLMATMFEKWKTADSAEGVVLVDEVESHLHPIWKMRIVEALRATFPRIQFIITTHDPLCIRGFKHDEVCVLHRNSGDNQVRALTSLPISKTMRIDEILTSSHFGLTSTLGLAARDLLNQYYEELDSNDDGDVEKIALLERAASLLDSPAVLERDRIMYKVIDKFIASQPGFIVTKENESECLALVNTLAEEMRNSP
jgi:energy-coupling factor transporter ATP-binding protein EcfA2